MKRALNPEQQAFYYCFHAAPSEILLTLYAYPEEMKSASISPALAPIAAISIADNYRAQFADGRIGSNPTPAKIVEPGEHLLDTCARDVIADYSEFIST